MKMMRGKGMEEYLWQNEILFKDYSDHVKRVSERVKKASLEPYRKQGLPVEFVRSPAVDKDELGARWRGRKAYRVGWCAR